MFRGERHRRALAHAVDLLRQHCQHLLCAGQRRLVIGNVDGLARGGQPLYSATEQRHLAAQSLERSRRIVAGLVAIRSEEHTSELQSLMRISYAVFCLKKKKQKTNI